MEKERRENRYLTLVNFKTLTHVIITFTSFIGKMKERENRARNICGKGEPG